MAQKQIIIFDNGGKTVDRYTGVLTKTGDVVGFNENPFHPCGFGQFCGNVTDRMNVTYGYGWRKHFKESKVLKVELKHYIAEAKNNPAWLGKKVELESLSEQAQKYVRQILEQE